MKPLLAVLALVFIFLFGCGPKIIVLPDGKSIEVLDSDVWKKITSMAELENNKKIKYELLDNVVGIKKSKKVAKIVALKKVFSLGGNVYRNVGTRRVYYESLMGSQQRAYEYEVEAYKCRPVK